MQTAGEHDGDGLFMFPHFSEQACHPWPADLGFVLRCLVQSLFGCELHCPKQAAETLSNKIEHAASPSLGLRSLHHVGLIVRHQLAVNDAALHVLDGNGAENLNTKPSSRKKTCKTKPMAGLDPQAT